MRATRILHVVVSLGGGGLERMVVDLAREQVTGGAQVAIACLFPGGRLEASAREAGIEVHDLRKRRGPDPAAVWRLAALCRRLRIQVVHTHNAMPAYYAAATRLLGLKVPLVNSHHNAGTLRPERIKTFFFAWASRAHASVAFVSRESMERLCALGEVRREQACVVVNGIRVADYVGATTASRADARKALGLPADRVLVGTVGRLVDVKDQAALIDAVLALAAEGLPVALALVGDGPLRAALEARALAHPQGKLVSFLGERSDVAKLLPSFDVFALPSLSEGYSIALVEASAAGLPIVASEVGGNPEIVQDGVTGTLVPPSTPARLRQALRELVEDSPRRARYGAAAAAWAREHGDVAAMSRVYDGLYSAAILGRARVGVPG